MLTQIKALIDQKYTLTEIADILNKDYLEIKKIINALKVSNIKEEREEYERLKKQIMINRNDFLKKVGRENKSNNQYNVYTLGVINLKRNIINLIKNKKITVEKGAELLGISLNATLFLLEEENLRLPHPVLQDIIEKYREKDLYFSKEYASKSYNLQKEIVMVALTFRVSKENMCQVLQTSLDDIERVYRCFPNLSQYFSYLEEETANEKKELKELAFHKAQKYFKTRQLYVQNGANAKKNQDILKVKAYEERLQDLRQSIMDFSINDLKTKTCLNEEEIKRVIDYRIKYSLSLDSICHTFPISYQTIETYEEALILNDKTGYYQEKLAFLHHKYATIVRSFYKGNLRK